MLTVDHISKSFGDVKAVNDLTFSVKKGEIVGLLGPNGAGKTTTMRIMSGFLSPDSGDVKVDDISVMEDPIKAQSIIGYLPENNPLYKDMLVGELLNFSADLKKMTNSEKKDALDFAVSSVNIEDVYYRVISELSKGYKQRVGIALALLHKPEILIMDEPTEGLDPNQRGEIRQLIKKLSKNHTIIVSTHVMQEVEAICSRMVIITGGKKVADGSVDELSQGAKSEKVIYVEIQGDKVEDALKKVEGVKELEFLSSADSNVVQAKMTTGLTVSVQPEISKLAGKHGWTIWRLNEEKQQLEEIFKELTSEKKEI
jgi:ABC-2 type transport system ATP-binding protein